MFLKVIKLFFYSFLNLHFKEFDPDEFYQLLEEAEGAVRIQLGSGSARVPDLPQYIVSKLGLNRNIQLEEEHGEGGNSAELGDGDTAALEPISPPEGKELMRKAEKSAEAVGKSLAQEAPKEEDFETIRVRKKENIFKVLKTQLRLVLLYTVDQQRGLWGCLPGEASPHASSICAEEDEQAHTVVAQPN